MGVHDVHRGFYYDCTAQNGLRGVQSRSGGSNRLFLLQHYTESRQIY